MQYKLPSTSYFHTYIPAQNRLGEWMVYENSTGKLFGIFQTEGEADNHARTLNDTWVQEFYETRPASEHAPAPHPYMYRSESLASQLKNFWVDIALYCRPLFQRNLVPQGCGCSPSTEANYWRSQKPEAGKMPEKHCKCFHHS